MVHKKLSSIPRIPAINSATPLCGTMELGTRMEIAGKVRLPKRVSRWTLLIL